MADIALNQPYFYSEPPLRLLWWITAGKLRRPSPPPQPATQARRASPPKGAQGAVPQFHAPYMTLLTAQIPTY